MDIKPIDLTVKTLLESSFYRVPRFQRPYSWDRENVSDFWTDAVASDDKDYFIGSFVVFKVPTNDTLLVVDGQQRLTTITLLLAALRDALAQNDDGSLALGVQSLIERKDINNELQFVLQSETPYPFLQEHIQKFGPPDLPAMMGVEEEALKAAYEFLTGQVRAALASIETDPTIETDKKPQRKRKALVGIRDKVLHLQLIQIQLSSEDDAYIIFETLNTRGKDLRVADLVKNHLTRLIKPKNKGVDSAKDKWEKILAHFEEASTDVDVNRFLHHSWLSRKPYVPEKKLFKEIRKTVKRETASVFLDSLASDARMYRMIVDPASHKWPKDERPCQRSLKAMNLFRVVQPVPMLLSVVRAYDDDRLSLRQVAKLLRRMENFHFQFSAVTAQRTGGGTGQMFALAARDLQAATTKNQAGQALKRFEGKLRERLPSYAEFEAGFERIWHTEASSKQRGLVRYLLGRIREHEEEDSTTNYDDMTIEHLSSQSPADGSATPVTKTGAIGNLILVTKELNDKLKNKPFDKKIQILKAAHYPLDAWVKSASKWEDGEIVARTKALAKLSHDEVFKV
jgi:hypothetical protein